MYAIGQILIRSLLLMSMMIYSCLSYSAINLPFLADLPFTYNAEFSYLNNDNIGRSQQNADIEKDNILQGTVSANYFRGIGNKAAVVFDGGITLTQFFDFSDLSNTELFFTASYLMQPTISYTSIRYRAFASIKNIDSESNLRDRTGFTVGFEASKRFTTKIQATIGISNNSQSASGRVFDIDRNRFFINADYTLSNQIALYLTYSQFDGDIVSSSTPTLAILENNLALAPDDGIDNLVAYRLDANTNILTFGANYALDSKSALDASLEILDSSASGGINYDRTIINMTYLRGF